MHEPIPAYVKDESGTRHYRGSAEYERILTERSGPSPLELAMSRIEELTAINEELTARCEAAAAKAEEERSRAEEAAAPLLERLQDDGSTKAGGRDATA